MDTLNLARLSIPPLPSPACSSSLSLSLSLSLLLAMLFQPLLGFDFCSDCLSVCLCTLSPRCPR
ncbi:hypothetical protein KC19_7G189900 [Ceratodon purpureus]|uniref:Uncharacterized protein n=1 Tax=Ceratodon purpureus TaxID=3225 RepID=A0A8T0H883_CERPU|nr:hypothetical protein KC19_7G189900 [Ceratodon purpureus]